MYRLFSSHTRKDSTHAVQVARLLFFFSTRPGIESKFLCATANMLIWAAPSLRYPAGVFPGGVAMIKMLKERLEREERLEERRSKKGGYIYRR